MVGRVLGAGAANCLLFLPAGIHHQSLLVLVVQTLIWLHICSIVLRGGGRACECYQLLLCRVSANPNRASCTDSYVMTLGNWNATSVRALPPRWGRFRPQYCDNDVAQRMRSYRSRLFRLGSLSTTISLLKTFLMVLTLKMEEVKNRIGLFGLEPS